MKTYNLRIGAHICLVISIISIIPRIIRIDSYDYLDIFFNWLNIFLILLVFWLIHHFFILSKQIKGTFLKAVLGIVVCTISSVVFHKITEFFFVKRDYFGISDLAENKQIVVMVFRGGLLGSLLYFIIYYLQILLEKQKVKIELEKVKQENLEARLNSLIQQISPHFLFNSLSTLKTIAKDAETKDYIIQLSKVYRYLLSYNESTTSTLRDELDFTNAYLYIMNQRFEQALVVKIDINDDVLLKKIPPLTIQILIENAIKHNVLSIEEPLTIEIVSSDAENIIVKNNVRPKLSGKENTGKGLQNISGRYQLLSKKEIEIRKDEAYFIVVIPLLP